MTAFVRFAQRLSIVSAVAIVGIGTAVAQALPKPRVADLIMKVENGVDDFRDYLEKRGDNAKDAASTAQAQGKEPRRKATDTEKSKAGAKKDALDDALGDLNQSTNRLRRKLDPTDNGNERRSGESGR